jgi:hypothetical protein
LLGLSASSGVFNWDIFNLKSARNSRSFYLSSEPLTRIIEAYEKYIKHHSQSILSNQQSIEHEMQALQSYTMQINNTINTRAYHLKRANEKFKTLNGKLCLT